MALTGELASAAEGDANDMSLSDVSSDVPTGVEGGDQAISKEKALAPSELSNEKLALVLKGWFRADAQHSAVWRKDAAEWFRFRAGDQWSDEDKLVLNSQARPHIVFNRVLTVLKAVAGMEINGRHEIAFLPRNNADTEVNELLSAASKWMADGCDAEDEESSAFEDVATCGMGWCENRLDYIEQWNGKYVEEKIDPLEMFWDRTANKKNLTNARRMSRRRKMPIADAKMMFPGFNRAQLDAGWADMGLEGSEPLKTVEEKRWRTEDNSELDYDDSNEVTIVHMQWWEIEYYWKVANKEAGSLVDMTDKQYETLQQRLEIMGASDKIEAVRLPRKVFHQAFLGNDLLKKEVSPVKNQFTWKCITGEHDKMRNSWFGLVQVMMDPQRWSNKWLSQVLHIVNTTAKGGILAEEDAFPDWEEAENKYARPDTITRVARGAIKEGKIMPKPGQGITEGIASLLQYAISSIRDVTGINLELLGQQDQNQPGILEQYRKQAGMTILATLFDSLRRFRKQTGWCRLYLIQNYLADGRLVRVVGPEFTEALPLLRDKCLGEYDVVVDDTPTSPNQKEANWAIIQPMLAIFKDQLVGNPQMLVMLLEYSPLPSRVVSTLKGMLEKQDQDPEKEKMKNLGVMQIVAGINKDQSVAEKNLADAGKSQATAAYDIALAQKFMEGGEVEKLKMHLEAMASRVDLEKKGAELQLGHEKVNQQRLKNMGEAQRARGEAHKAQSEAHYSDMARYGAIGEANKAHHENVKTTIDLVTPRKEGQAAPMHAARRHLPAHPMEPRQRPALRPPARSDLPPGTRRGRDGHYYSPDPARKGKWLRMVFQSA